MSVRLHVGNISFTTTNQDLSELFASVGSVTSCNIIEDRDTGRSRGFGFIEMASRGEAQNAIAQLNGREIDGRELKVAEAKPKQPRNSGGEIRESFRVDSYIGHSGRAYMN